MDLQQTIRNVAASLSDTSAQERVAGVAGRPLPSVEAIAEMMRLVRRVLLPGFFDEELVCNPSRMFHIGVDLERISTLLSRQIALSFDDRPGMEAGKRRGYDLASGLISLFPEIRRVLLTDVEAIVGNDPAVGSAAEVVHSYPGVQVMIHHRVAHALYRLGVPVLPRIIAEQAHSATGIDIHPAARIGEYFGIDHGTGIVIGATTVIGHHVMLYQGVTLGARNFKRDEEGLPIDRPRHPILEDHVVVYSGASILGRVTIGHDSVIGGNVWLTHDVPPYSRVLQSAHRSLPSFADGAGI